MKALKYIISSSIFLAIAVIVGCSDNLTSPLTSESHMEPASSITEETTFSTQITLGGNQTVVFDSRVTSFDLIVSYSISNCAEGSTRNLFISSSAIGGTTSLPCTARFPDIIECRDLSIQNISGKKQSIKVTLRGK